MTLEAAFGPAPAAQGLKRDSSRPVTLSIPKFDGAIPKHRESRTYTSIPKRALTLTFPIVEGDSKPPSFEDDVPVSSMLKLPQESVKLIKVELRVSPFSA
jgi:hypothetical protein